MKQKKTDQRQPVLGTTTLLIIFSRVSLNAPSFPFTKRPNCENERQL